MNSAMIRLSLRRRLTGTASHFHRSLCRLPPNMRVNMKMRGKNTKDGAQCAPYKLNLAIGHRLVMPSNNGFGRRPFPFIGGHGRPPRSPVDRMSTGRPFFGDHVRSPRGPGTGCPFGRIPKPGGVGGAGACAPPTPGLVRLWRNSRSFPKSKKFNARGGAAAPEAHKPAHQTLSKPTSRPRQ